MLVERVPDEGRWCWCLHDDGPGRPMRPSPRVVAYRMKQGLEANR